ncbi:MAG: PHP domain-containing protein [Eubacterium sp.]|nr:PHP domain-containing protein [Eubacterium sp.]
MASGNKTAVDLHIHSVLSPCGGEDMTPNNIVNMALIKELDYIAVTDHNTAKNLPAVVEAAKGAGLCVLPGIEVTTKEEAHVLAYFADLSQAMALDALLYEHLPDIPNRVDFFGPQYIMDAEDEIVGEVDKLLISATDLSVDDLAWEVTALGGIIVPAHIDRKTYSIVASLGFVPPELPVGTVEISKAMDFETAKKSFRFFKPYKMIHGSDAHQLEDIAEREYFLELEDLQKTTLLRHLQ